MNAAATTPKPQTAEPTDNQPSLDPDEVPTVILDWRPSPKSAK
ncbi:hypothetical protein [Prosthecobacter sp.]